ncbi:hypothetical protein SEVIR_7G067400v4 [Setaria viridis]|uniref:Uncharacterized protein n=2 Tax=Setaria TaxID=4554 RepID=A0A368RSN2_SETIT|nr:uncharacterized protein LOC101768054 [Setaria italica]XP_034602537.1 uncharacterized protein LOC117863064 [Setaria viridis]XP_034602538.1 uncharacterized protein LOC117863065 [Setaria viridis]RCV33169.1 hypothetical protein SETIT_7G061000v2 [Setaria italica]TKW03804.1 hypothetical protein SEVIR_7G067175v2 [Setaria viridis]TKW03806.1 hypothetical protein SEVIR_7G067400v2 [Setaria viridis]
MDRRRAYASLLVLVGVLLALASPVVAGGMSATFAAGVGVGDAAALRRLMSTRLEDGVAPELTVDLELHRRVLAGVIKPGALNPNRPACIRSCPAPGQPYNRGCKAIYHCPH